MNFYIPDPSAVRDISKDVLNANGRFQVLPASYWATTTPVERALFGQRFGIYCFPTIELVSRLRSLIGRRTAIEIGAGNGVLAEALGIPAVDSRQQEKEPYRTHYALRNQAIVPYGTNVVEMDAYAALRHYKPEVVIGCWVTHRYNPQRHNAGGHEAGIDDEDVLRQCAQYVLVGNRAVHRQKTIWGLRHSIEYPSYVYSRAHNGSPDFIAWWEGRRARPRGKR